MAETEFFNHDGVIVTKTRVVVKNTTYPISSLSAVRFTQSSSIVSTDAYTNCNLIAVCTSFVGVYFLLNNQDSDSFYILLFASFCIALFANSLKDTIFLYHVTIHTNGRNLQVFTSDDKREIEDIVKAINEAIIDRG